MLHRRNLIRNAAATGEITPLADSFAGAVGVPLQEEKSNGMLGLLMEGLPLVEDPRQREPTMHRQFSRVEEALEAIEAGRIVIVVDSEDREDEGDLIAAADRVTPETIHFMISQGRGQLCMPVLPDVAQRLNLTPMVPKTNGSLPRFAVPIDHQSCRTGISPAERALSIQAIVDPASRSEDFVRPGHVFPLLARSDGVLERTGHTESTIDLARLAGRAPAGVLCEVCSRDGMHMADRDELLALAAEFQLPIITIESLIEYRLQQDGHSTAVASGTRAF